jgi:hypothetical protein
MAPRWAFPALARAVVRSQTFRRASTIRGPDEGFSTCRRSAGRYAQDQFFTTQRTAPDGDAQTYRLKVPGSLTVRKSSPRRYQALGRRSSMPASSARATADVDGPHFVNSRWFLPCATFLRSGGQESAREVVFFATGNRGSRVRGGTRWSSSTGAASRRQGLSSEPFLAHALNGEPLTVQGFPHDSSCPGGMGAERQVAFNVHVQEIIYRKVPGARTARCRAR